MLMSKRFASGLAATVLVLLATSDSLSASTTLREKLRPLAKDIHDVLIEEKQQAVDFAEIPGDRFTGSNSGPGLQQLLIEELQAVANSKNIVKEGANVQVRANYTALKTVDDIGRTLRIVKIEIAMIDDRGKELLKRHIVVDTSEDIARLVGYTGDLPPNANKGDLNKKIQDYLAKPEVHLQGTKIFSRAGQPFALEVLVKAAGDSAAKPRQPVEHKGKAFVDIQRNEIYELRIHNLASFEAAITVNIDGLDVFTFSEDLDPKTGRSRFTHYMVPANSAASVLGWHQTIDRNRKDNVLSFLVTEYGKGAASSRKVVGKVGAITVTFAAAWKGDNKPADEGGSRTGGANETGKGPPREVGFLEVQRTIGNVRDQITVWYDRSRKD